MESVPTCFGGLACRIVVVAEYPSAEIVLKGIESVIIHSYIIEIDRKIKEGFNRYHAIICLANDYGLTGDEPVQLIWKPLLPYHLPNGINQQ